MNGQNFRGMIFEMQSKRMRETLDLLKGFIFHNLEFRVADYLFRREVESIVDVTHIEASEDIGCSRERLSRSFKKLEDLELIEMLGKGKYKLELKKLQQIYNL